MIQSKPNSIPQYDRFTGGAFPRAEAMKYKIPSEKYQNIIKHPKQNVVVNSPMQMLVQRNPLDQSLPSYKTPFDLRVPQSKLCGVAGRYGTTTQNGKPLRAQTGIGFKNLPPCEPLKNRNF